VYFYFHAAGESEGVTGPCLVLLFPSFLPILSILPVLPVLLNRVNVLMSLHRPSAEVQKDVEHEKDVRDRKDRSRSPMLM
jgi:hypothetical protein